MTAGGKEYPKWFVHFYIPIVSYAVFAFVKYFAIINLHLKKYCSYFYYHFDNPPGAPSGERTI